MASRFPSEWRTVDYYAELGVASDATFDDVTRRYRALAKQLHPDMRPDDPTAAVRFARVSSAHEVLSDPFRRHDYDVYRRTLQGDAVGPREASYRPPSAGRAGGAGRSSSRAPGPTRRPARAKSSISIGVVIVILVLVFLIVAGLSRQARQPGGLGTRPPASATVDGRGSPSFAL